MNFLEINTLRVGDKVREISSGKIGYVYAVYYSKNLKSCEVHAKDIAGDYLNYLPEELEIVKEKLFLFDSKHQKVIAEMSITDEAQTETIIKFLDDNGVTDKYHSLIIAEKYEIKYDDGDPFVEFE